MKTLLSIVLMMICCQGFAAKAVNSASRILTITCPAIKMISKNPSTRTWSAPGGWKSHETSFVNTIKSFLGAQWNGANVGQVTCVYQGKTRQTFPILLVYNTLSFEPHGHSWSKNLGGIRNCKAKDIKACPFQVQLKPKKENFYQQLEQMKSN